MIKHKATGQLPVAFLFYYLNMKCNLKYFNLICKVKKRLAIFLVFVLVLAIQPKASAQCAMCSANAEMSVKNGNTQGKGLNTGILYLLAIPYLLISGVGVLWYVNYRKKKTASIA